MEQFNEGRMPRRNAAPTPPTPPAPLYHQRTPNPNAYESAADIVARRNAERARMNPIPRGQGGMGATPYFGAPAPTPQMPALPRQGMFGLAPQAPNNIQTPFHHYPNFGGGQYPDIPDFPEGFHDELRSGSPDYGMMSPEEEMMLAQEILGVQIDPNTGKPVMPGRPAMPPGKKWYNYNPNNIPDGRSVYDHLSEDIGNAWNGLFGR